MSDASIREHLSILAAQVANLTALIEQMHEKHQHPAPALDDLLGVKEASRLTGFSISTIRRWCDDHAIGWRTKTGSRVVSKRLLLDLISSRAHE